MARCSVHAPTFDTASIKAPAALRPTVLVYGTSTITGDLILFTAIIVATGNF